MGLGATLPIHIPACRSEYKYVGLFDISILSSMTEVCWAISILTDICFVSCLRGLE